MSEKIKYICQTEERKFKGIARKNITLRTPMKRGQKILEKNIIMKRPGTGLDGQKIKTIIGKKLKI